MSEFKFTCLGSLGVLLILMSITQGLFYVIAFFCKDRYSIYNIMRIHQGILIALLGVMVICELL